jgi:serine/threonine protein kinase
MKYCPTCKSKFPTDINYCPNDATRLEDDPETGPSHSLIGMILDNRYRIISKLGEGGMGSVYAAEHILLKKGVAIKVLRYDLAMKEDVVKRFQNEAIAASRIGHENIIEVTDFGRTPDGSVYFVMEQLNGSSLADVIQKSGSIPLKRAIPILLQITKALSAAHAQGIIHRDLKPENIILIDKGERKDFVKILDFGISKMMDTSDRAEKLTAMGMIVGTPEYMSPEQAAGKSVDKRTDIYSLGVIMYEMATGRLPFIADNAIRILMMHQTEKPARPRDINPEIHADFEQIILRCLEKKPEDRFQDMNEITQALIRLISGMDRLQEPKKTIAFMPQALTQVPPQVVQTQTSTTSMPRVTQSQQVQVSPPQYSPPVPSQEIESVQVSPQPPVENSVITPVNTVPPVIVTGTEREAPTNTGITENVPEAKFYRQDAAAISSDEVSISSDIEEVPKKGRLPLMIGGVVIILLIGAGLLWFLSKGGSSSGSVNLPQPTVSKVQEETGVKSGAEKREELKEEGVAGAEKKEEEGASREVPVAEKTEKANQIRTAKNVESVVLSIDSSPENVEIYRGSVLIGVTPYQLKGKLNSSSEYVFKKVGFEPLKKRLVFDASKRVQITLKPIEQKKAPSKKEKDPFEKIDDLKDLSF